MIISQYINELCVEYEIFFMPKHFRDKLQQHHIKPPLASNFTSIFVKESWFLIVLLPHANLRSQTQPKLEPKISLSKN